MKTSKAIRVNAMFKAYKDYKEYFASLLSESIPEDDKEDDKVFAKETLESLCPWSLRYYEEIRYYFFRCKAKAVCWLDG